MWILLLILFYPFVLVDSSHAKNRQNCTIVPMSCFGPKTFYGTKASTNDQNLTLEVPELIISNSHENYTSDYTFISTRIIPVAYVMAIVIGIPSNTLVLAFLSRKTRCLSSAILYLSLATSDLLLLVSLTLKVHYHLNGNNWVFGELACKLVTACFYGNMYCCIHTHMCISMLRYLAVVHPFLYRGLAKRSWTAWASLTVWIVFVMAMAPEFLIHQSYLTKAGTITCHDILPYDEKLYNFLIPYRLCLIFLGFIFPFTVLIFAYGSIVYHLSRSRCNYTYYIKAITLVFVIFLVCFTPSNTIHLIHYVKLYTSKQDDLYKYFSVVVCVCCFHSCLDPFLFYFITKPLNFRLNFVSLTRISPRSSVII